MVVWRRELLSVSDLSLILFPDTGAKQWRHQDTQRGRSVVVVVVAVAAEQHSASSHLLPGQGITSWGICVCVCVCVCVCMCVCVCLPLFPD